MSGQVQDLPVNVNLISLSEFFFCNWSGCGPEKVTFILTPHRSHFVWIAQNLTPERNHKDQSSFTNRILECKGLKKLAQLLKAVQYSNFS